MNTPEGLDKIFKPRSVAVIGATSRPGTIGRELTHNLIAFDFKGKIFPVNPTAQYIHSIKCYPSVLDIPDPVDLAMIVVRRDLVLGIVEECGQKGVGGIVIITAGFRETGAEGAALEDRIMERCRHYKMRLIGPNCFGVINTNESVSLNATFARTPPLPGRIGFMSQSGALGEAILNHARRLGIGFSMFASVGNKTDVSGNTLLSYWRDDPDTQIILLYLESFGDAESFTRIAREVSRSKPIIAVKSGKTFAGARATISHTGAMAGHDIGVDALFDQCGVLRVESMEELFDLALAMDRQPVPRGNRVAILTNAGGPGILATDAAVNSGLEMATLADKTVATLRANLPAAAATGNPVDMIASADGKDYRMALDALFADANVDALICIFVPPVMIDELAVAEAIIDARGGTDKPLLACFMGPGEGMAGSARLKSAGIPVYTFPEEIANVYRMMHKYNVWRARPARGAGPVPDRVEQARRKLTELAAAGTQQLSGQSAGELLAMAGIPTAPLRTAADPTAAVSIAESLGYPVVLKLEADGLTHKTEIGGVIVDIRTADEVTRHYAQLIMRAQKSKLMHPRIAVQAMVDGGVEMALGMVRDPKFGPLVMCGLGGVFIEVVRDIAFRLPPVTREDAREMVESLKGYKLLTGYRGAPPCDLNPLLDALVAISQLVSGMPCLHELDINPFVVTPAGETSCAIDARILFADSV